ncbi:MAG: GatB/YqeY domain-containing protein [Bacilli bacterium]|nr:GatB/YqeY domain-containing protein [Bacilli bacterium]
MKEKLQKDMIESMKEHNKKKTDTIKSIKAAVQMEEINLKRELTDEEVISIITKQIKMRKDAINDFEKAGRSDLISSYNEEINILNEYLPKQLTDDEINRIIDEAFNVIKPTSNADIGKIMKEILPKLKNRADMGKVNIIIKNKLSKL